VRHTLHTGASRAWVAPLPYGAVRRLTPLECERLQGFPDGWTAVLEDRAKPTTREEALYLMAQVYRSTGVLLSMKDARYVLSDSQRYKQMGNAVSVPVARWIAHNLRTIIEGESDARSSLPA